MPPSREPPCGGQRNDRARDVTRLTSGNWGRRVGARSQFAFSICRKPNRRLGLVRWGALLLGKAWFSCAPVPCGSATRRSPGWPMAPSLLAWKASCRARSFRSGAAPRSSSGEVEAATSRYDAARPGWRSTRTSATRRRTSRPSRASTCASATRMSTASKSKIARSAQ